MLDILEKLHKVNENDGNDDYEMDVDLSVYMEGLQDGEEHRYPDSIHMKYNIQVEYRSWGIKDISVIPREAVGFEVEIIDVNDDIVDTVNVELDFDQYSKISWVPGAGFAPESIEVTIKRDGTVTDIDFNFYYASH